MAVTPPVAERDETEPQTKPAPRRRAVPLLRRRRLAVLAVLGPGLIAAMAGDDAGGIATYASVGAEYGYALLWALALITISLAVVQEMAMRMGAVTGKGFAELVREELGVRMTAFIMAALLAANAGLVVSEFVGIGAAGELFGIPRWLAVPPMALLVWWLVTRGSYERVERVFLALTLAFLAYPAAAFLARPDWATVGREAIHPTISLTPAYITLFVAMVGTTITPYMQLYAQSSLAERGAGSNLRGARIDAYAGAVVSDLVAAFIIIATGATLFVRGQSVETAADAARALGPAVGPFAPYVFGAGLFGASMLAAGVLPLATAYTVTEAFGFEKGVSLTFREAPVFLGLFTGLIVVGAAVALLPVNVIQLLVMTQVLNGLLLPVVLAAMLRLVNDREVMGAHVNRRRYNAVAWTTVALVTLLSTAYLILTVLGWFGVGPG
ncbi:MAG TPA: divalent metal cation transporter [Thermomicrobiales bacterium]|nr:divalent metal cation transporter [Thermomicrobiales bacterium]